MKPIIWSGDYADGETDPAIIAKADPTSYYCTDFSQETEPNLYNMVAEEGLKFLIDGSPDDHNYIINFDKKLYVDKTKVPSGDDIWGNGELFKIHPLPLLTCEGNGRRGGDFRGEDPNELIGSWARNRLGLRKEIPEGFTELIFDLIEK